MRSKRLPFQRKASRHSNLPAVAWAYWESKDRIPAELVRKGWHYCAEWDGMLIHKTWPEMEVCICDLAK